VIYYLDVLRLDCNIWIGQRWGVFCVECSSQSFPTMTFLYSVIISALCTFGKLMWFQGFEFFLVFCIVHANWSWYCITKITNILTSTLHGLVLVHHICTLLMPGPLCMQIAKHFYIIEVFVKNYLSLIYFREFCWFWFVCWNLNHNIYLFIKKYVNFLLNQVYC
jgi:hypothetical protein